MNSIFLHKNKRKSKKKDDFTAYNFSSPFTSQMDKKFVLKSL